MAKPDRRGFAQSPRRGPNGRDPQQRGPSQRGPASGVRAGGGAPPARFDHDDEDDPRRGSARNGVTGALFLLLLLGFGVFVWDAYGGGSDIRASIARVTAPEPYKTPGPGEDGAASASLEGLLRNPAPVAQAELAPEPEQPATPVARPDPSSQPMPVLVRNGPFVAQIAALQQERSIDPLWRRLSSRAPDLFAGAQLDVQRADLGPRGISNRVRVGYFADRENAVRFCDRLSAMGQQCLVAQR